MDGQTFISKYSGKETKFFRLLQGPAIPEVFTTADISVSLVSLRRKNPSTQQLRDCFLGFEFIIIKEHNAEGEKEQLSTMVEGPKNKQKTVITFSPSRPPYSQGEKELITGDKWCEGEMK